MSLKLYHFTVSGPSRGALLAARYLQLPIEIQPVNTFKKDNLKESFLKINPQHCVPTLEDNGFILWESRAIACYLADKYGKDEQFYPKDLQKRAFVNQRLYFDATFLNVKMRAICAPILFSGATEIQKPLKDDFNTTLGFLDIFLSSTKWLAGDNPTVADTASYATLSSILAVGWDISSFPNIQRWVKQCGSLPGAEENDAGAKEYGEAVKKNLR
ncbi:glutathione S-transferase 1-like [Trichoplusia ni]|uniref:Glutathione S-transferase 1-like n=1 Tax=Trichoplusia ni TaxID=7111 RepID=A0A7E5WIQ1_TRINI|nr:glutathione S-transferase 1-like [Trichoplusia ni]XP_026740613.1 glutathione S-transferase 1-like [Trichoplusia ni]